MKETYYPNLGDDELQLILEVATRSLLAKNLLLEETHRYKLKDSYKKYIKVLNYADRTLKASKFTLNLENEESISIHYFQDEAFLHFLQHNQQIHSILPVKKDRIIDHLKDFFACPSIEN